MNYKIEAVRASGKRLKLAVADNHNYASEVSKWALKYPRMTIEARTINNNTLLMRRRGG